MNRRHLEKNLYLAVEHHKAGRSDEAAALYAEIRAAFPKLFDGWYLGGTLEVHRDKPEAAIPLLTRALRIDRNSAQCKLFLGMALADTGRHAEAEKPLREALQKLPNYPEAWENLADALVVLEKPTEALTCLRRLLELRPDREDVRERIAAMAEPSTALL